LKNGVIKIADFGLAKKIYNKRYKSQKSAGTPNYMALQLLKCEPYSSKCDIWALGVIFY
jgi:serine/threonine protein kinase